MEEMEEAMRRVIDPSSLEFDEYAWAHWPKDPVYVAMPTRLENGQGGTIYFQNTPAGELELPNNFNPAKVAKAERMALGDLGNQFYVSRTRPKSKEEEEEEMDEPPTLHRPEVYVSNEPWRGGYKVSTYINSADENTKPASFWERSPLNTLLEGWEPHRVAEIRKARDVCQFALKRPEFTKPGEAPARASTNNTTTNNTTINYSDTLEQVEDVVSNSEDDDENDNDWSQVWSGDPNEYEVLSDSGSDTDPEEAYFTSPYFERVVKYFHQGFKVSRCLLGSNKILHGVDDSPEDFEFISAFIHQVEGTLNEVFGKSIDEMHAWMLEERKEERRRDQAEDEAWNRQSRMNMARAHTRRAGSRIFRD
ncbi:hypothetical protein B0H67DRAFT_200563 [Lasiosphaeris hirsuta]|uniref:Uncharacterized protein n=1 Tax=Lasiosphaeris hirsuta TaxID=260670 RepID=A0AA40ARL9_9PEZI|nr:hypothetical protein B0H67DRAFT_200563 [Lasiosphaeris hirsuta]